MADGSMADAAEIEGEDDLDVVAFPRLAEPWKIEADLGWLNWEPVSPEAKALMEGLTAELAP
jgi:hypothetical protein